MRRRGRVTQCRSSPPGVAPPSFTSIRAFLVFSSDWMISLVCVFSASSLALKSRNRQAEGGPADGRPLWRRVMQYLQSPEGGGREPGRAGERRSVLSRRGAVALADHDWTDWVPEVRKSLSTAFCGGQRPCRALLEKHPKKKEKTFGLIEVGMY